ncbi:MAG TPA: FkbM family methyltransferase [Acidimicrobiales bacterium]|nr:FkbM family methyltransferase [Acidimicrobiales bacterium]
MSLHPEARRRSSRLLSIYQKLIGPGDLCFDVGAHVGVRTELFRSLGARVIAVEPQPDLAARLARRWAGDSNVTVVAKALGATPGCGFLAIPPGASKIASMAPRWRTGRFSDYDWNRTIAIEVGTLDSIISCYGTPAFCKIDVEGYELQVLYGLSRPLPVLSIEFTSEFLDDLEACLAYLQSFGELRVNFTVQEDARWSFPEWIPPKAVLDSLQQLVMHHPDLWGDVYVATAKSG